MTSSSTLTSSNPVPGMADRAHQAIDRAAEKAAPTLDRVRDRAHSTIDKVADTASNASSKVAVAADDTAITAKVKAALIAEPGLKSTEINVDTKEATVTLSGTVASNELRDRAKQIASSTSGVKNVVDNLVVKSA